MPIEQAKVGRVAAKLVEELEQYGRAGRLRSTERVVAL
jgi:hypothetical protein